MKHKRLITFAIAIPVLLILFLFLLRPSIGYGHSMEPTINDGSITFMQTYLLPKNLTGFIVVFQYDGECVDHRCLADNGTHLMTMGDNNPCADPPIPKENVVGVLIGWINFGSFTFTILSFREYIYENIGILSIIWVIVGWNVYVRYQTNEFLEKFGLNKEERKDFGK